MEAWRLAMDVEYDAGSFDKDAQGWCANVHSLRLEGDTLHVHTHGDANGERPFETRSSLRVLGAVPGLEVVLLAEGANRPVFDLRARQLHRGSLTATETISPAHAPEGADLDGWIARALRVHGTTAGRPSPAAALAWSPPRGYPLGGPGATFTRGEIGPTATADVLRDGTGRLLSITVTRGNDPRVAVGWGASAPLAAEARGWLHAHQLGWFRLAARRELFVGLPAWDEDARQLAAVEALR